MVNNIAEYRNYQKHLELKIIRDLYLNENLTQYLKKYPKENETKFKWRQDVSYFQNFIEPVINGLTNMLFNKMPNLDNITDEVYLKNIDLNDNSLLAFIQKISLLAIRDGIAFIFADTTKGALDISLAEEENYNIRGYLKHWEYNQLVNWKYKDNKLTQIVFSDVVEVDKNEYQVELIPQYTRLFIGGGEVYQKVNGQISLIKQWSNSLDYIPISVAYGTTIHEQLEATPVIRKLINLNIAHYNLKSSLMNISHIASNPIPISYGMPQSGLDNSKLGVNTMIVYPTNQGNAFKFEWVEVSGNGVQIAERELKELENYIINSSFNILRVEKFTTATEARLKANENKNILNTIAVNVEQAVNNALMQLKDITKKESGYIEMNRDFDSLAISAENINTLITMRNSGMISLETLLNTFKDGEILKIDDIQAEIDKINNDFQMGTI